MSRLSDSESGTTVPGGPLCAAAGHGEAKALKKRRPARNGQALHERWMRLALADELQILSSRLAVLATLQLELNALAFA